MYCSTSAIGLAGCVLAPRMPRGRKIACATKETRQRTMSRLHMACLHLWREHLFHTGDYPVHRCTLGFRPLDHKRVAVNIIMAPGIHVFIEIVVHVDHLVFT